MSLPRILSGVAVIAMATTAFAAPASAAPEHPGDDVRPTIIDGQPAESGPWAARLFQGDRDRCTASVVAPDWVLTAQHCVEDPIGPISFKIGALKHSEGEVFKAKEGGVHAATEMDLALVQLERPTDVEVAPLGVVGDVNNGDTVQIFGWGATSHPDGEQSPVLKVASVDVVDIHGQDYIGGTAVQAKRGDGIAAPGDSGGPMFATKQDGTMVQVGVASTSDMTSTTNYTNVTEYRDWIKETAGI